MSTLDHFSLCEKYAIAMACLEVFRKKLCIEDTDDLLANNALDGDAYYYDMTLAYNAVCAELDRLKIMVRAQFPGWRPKLAPAQEKAKGMWKVADSVLFPRYGLQII